MANRDAVDAPFPARYDLGEGPLWDAEAGRLLFVDIDAGTIHSLDPRSGDDRSLRLELPVGFVVPVADGPELLAGTGGDVALLAPGGRVVARWRVEPGPPANRLNDGKADPAGRAWFGTMALDGTRGASALYRFDDDGLHTVTKGLSLSNGLGWDGERRRMYHIDSKSRHIDVYDYDVESGSVANRRTFATVDRVDGAPDGMTLDVDGCVWVALFGGSALRRYDPDGAEMAAIRLPVSCPTSVAFGGEDLSTLFVTTSRHELSTEQRAAEPLAGAVLVVDASVRGRPPDLVSAQVASTLRRSAP